MGGFFDFLGDLSFDWAEAVGVCFIIIGLLLGLFATRPYMLVGSVFLMGLMFGRAWFVWSDRGKVPLFLVIMGFLLGVLVWFFFVDPQVLIVTFCIAAWAGYMVFKKKLLRAVR